MDVVATDAFPDSEGYSAGAAESSLPPTRTGDMGVRGGEEATPTILVHRSEIAGMWSATFADGPRGLTWIGFDSESASKARRLACARWPDIEHVVDIDDVILTRPASPQPLSHRPPEVPR
jgi:hypothetical protein